MAKNDTETGLATGGSSASLSPEQAASQTFLASIASTSADDPKLTEKILGFYAIHAKTLGRQDLVKNVTDVLKKGQDGKIDLRKTFAGIIPDIIKTAKTKDIDAQAKEYEAYAGTLYGQQAERGKLKLGQTHEGFAGITSALRIKGLIGGILCMIPGMEETGKKWVEEVKAESLELANTLPETSKDVKRSAGKANITANASDITTSLDTALALLGPQQIAAEAGQAVAQVDATSSDTSFTKALNTKQPIIVKNDGKSPAHAPEEQTRSRPLICESVAGAGLPMCAPAPK